MKILITHAYTKENKGDAAILSVLLTQLRIAFPNSLVKISTFDDITINKTFEGYKNISSFIYLIIFSFKNKLLKGFYALYVISITVFWALSYRFFKINISLLLNKKIRTITNEILTSDLIVPIGGGYIRSKPGIKDTVDLLLVLHPILLSIILNKRIILYSQSIGPFYGTIQKYVAKFILNHTHLILVREDHTINTLKEIGVKKELIIRTIDAAFLFKSNKTTKDIPVLPKQLANKIVVGITVRQWLSVNKQRKYEEAIGSFINKLTKDNNYYCIFIPQVSSSLHSDDDREVATRIMSEVSNKKQTYNLTNIYTHHEIKAIYSKLDYIIGTRFHSVIFSLTEYVPAIAIEYEYKTSGIMKDLALSDWVIPIEKITSEILYAKFLSLTKQRDTYLRILRTNLPGYIQKAKKIVKYLRNTYNAVSTT